MNIYIPIIVIVLSNVVYHLCSKSTPKDINPFAALTITYIIGAIFSTILYFVINRGENILNEYSHLNWSSLALGLAIVGLEAGSIYMYKVGWNISTGQLVYSSALTVLLILIGFFGYHEAITANKIIGILLCMAGLYFVNR